jgi:antitoxin MazE
MVYTFVMETNIQKWGNSLGVRLPSQLAKKQSFKVGTRVLLKEAKNGILLKIVKQSPTNLKQLLSEITSDNLHQEVDWGESLGNEVW